MRKQGVVIERKPRKLHRKILRFAICSISSPQYKVVGFRLVASKAIKRKPNLSGLITPCLRASVVSLVYDDSGTDLGVLAKLVHY